MECQVTSRQRLGDLFHEWGPGVYRFALGLVRRPHEAEDVLQETFLKLMRHLDAGGDESNLRAWVFTVAANACRDRMRRRARWLSWTPETDLRVQAEAPPDDDGRVRAAQGALQRLSNRDRLLVTLRAQGLSYRDIAAAMSLQPASVGRLLARALGRWERAYHDAPVVPQAYGRSSS
ncbi:MAG: sigma-70 family RNA polymerase sigma factor [Acidobacteria bacterium]|nr:sigma-70 family RNA polymerase sigma factor [Acidobacteriota bacterium]